MSAADDLAAAVAELVGLGADRAELDRALESVAEIPDVPDPGALLTLAWILGAPAGEVVALLERTAAPGEASEVRARLRLLRNGHARAAGAARRAIGIDPEDLRHQFDELVAAGEVRGKRHALEVLSKRLHKSLRYLRRRLREGEGLSR